MTVNVFVYIHVFLYKLLKGSFFVHKTAQCSIFAHLPYLVSHYFVYLSLSYLLPGTVVKLSVAVLNRPLYSLCSLKNLLHGWMEFSYPFLPCFECWGIWGIKYRDLSIIHGFITSHPTTTLPKHSVHDRTLCEFCHSSNLFLYLCLFRKWFNVGFSVCQNDKSTIFFE